MVRKNSDITRLSQQFGKDIGSTTLAYEKSFGDYQKQRDELITPYDTAVKNYQDVLYPQYEQASSNYKTKLDSFNAELEDIKNNPKESKAAYKIISNAGQGNWSLQPTGVKDVEWWNDAYLLREIARGNLTKSGSKNLARGDIVYAKESRAVPSFSEKAPSAPSRPEAPVIPSFDDSEFKKQSQDLQAGYSRDLSERKASRLNVIGRKSSRPLMRDM